MEKFGRERAIRREGDFQYFGAVFQRDFQEFQWVPSSRGSKKFFSSQNLHNWAHTHPRKLAKLSHRIAVQFVCVCVCWVGVSTYCGRKCHDFRAQRGVIPTREIENAYLFRRECF